MTQQAFDIDIDAIARLTAEQRRERVQGLIAESHDILDRAIADHVTADGRRVVATAVLFSGGNDSTVLAHMMRDRVDLAIHANTGIGIEDTRQFVRRTCSEWVLPLLEVRAPREADHYRSLVLDKGFPGPQMHWKMYTRLKERALEAARGRLVKNPRQERVVFLAGRRRSESERRRGVVESERRGSTVWVSPMVNWTKLDLNTYRLLFGPVPVNTVSDLLHMSGECLCGAFATEGELDEIGAWFPDVVAEIRTLEAEIADRPDIPDVAKRWGWGATATAEEKRAARSGPMCSSCDARFIDGQMSFGEAS